MRNTSLSALGILLIALSASTAASARTVHQTGEQLRHANIDALRKFGQSYNQGDLNVQNFGFSGRDPSRVGGWDPSVNPSGS